MLPFHSTGEPIPSSNRLDHDWRVDLLRVLACVGVVVLHTTGQFQFEPTATKWGFSAVLFHDLARTAVPIFFILAGRFALSGIRNASDVVRFWSKRSVRLWIPTIVWSGIYLALFMVDRCASNTTIDINAVLGDWLLKGKPGAGYHLWFLYVLFIVEIVAPVATVFRIRSTQNERVTSCALFIITISFASYTIFSVVNGGDGRASLIFPILALGYLPWYALGLTLQNRIEKTPTEMKKNVAHGALFTAGLGIGSMVAITYSGGYAYARSDFLPPCALASIGVCCYILLQPDKVNPRFQKLLRFTAQSTLGIYLVHVVVLEVVMRSLSSVTTQQFAESVSGAFVAAALTFIASTIFVSIMKRTPILNRIV